MTSNRNGLFVAKQTLNEKMSFFWNNSDSLKTNVVRDRLVFWLCEILFEIILKILLILL